jgi:hypothetical protein
MAEPTSFDHDDDRPIWDAPLPPGGWGSPWPQCLELAKALPASKWTLVGGLMVQLHAAVAGMEVTRPTSDVDIILHVETGSVTASEVSETFRELGYRLLTSINDDAPAHRFIRGTEQIDVMVADHSVAKPPLILGRRKVFRIPAGTQALQRTVQCRIDTGEEAVTVSIPNTLGALVLKGAAYREDSRDRRRHLDDAAVLAATFTEPLEVVTELKGSDRSRIITLHQALADPLSPSWLMMEDKDRTHGQDALRILAANPQDFTLPNGLAGWDQTPDIRIARRP